METIQYLYERYPEAIKKRTNIGGFTCLYVVGEFGHFEAFKYFFELYPDAATFRTDQGQTILSSALIKRFFAIAEYLITKCPQTASIPGEAQRTPLHQGETCTEPSSVTLILNPNPHRSSQAVRSNQQLTHSARA